MANKTKQEQKRVKRIKSRREKHIHHSKALQAAAIPRWMAPVLLVVTTLAFLPVLGAGFVNLDDGEYVFQNTLLRSGDLGQLLSTPVHGNHHPFTMLTLYLNYLVSGNEAWSYHLVNLLLHLANTLLVFRLAMLLGGRNLIIAFTTAILFGIHPMHVESVAWISERKDVLYALFFLLGLIAYVRYLDGGSRRQFGLAILFLMLSLLSKPSAVAFPLAVLAIDFLRRRRVDAGMLAEKAAFFIPAIAMGLVTLLAQHEAGAAGQEEFSMMSRLLFGFYGIMMYFIKMVVPYGQSVFYPFPAINIPLPAVYYLAPFFFLLLIPVFLHSFRRDRMIAFGLLFFLANVVLVLQFLPVGSAVMAERYTYIAYAGLFFAAAYLLSRYAQPPRAWRILLPVVAVYSVLCFRQAGVWNNSLSLWLQAADNQPGNKAFANLGILMRNEGNPAAALDYFNLAISLNAIDYESYNNRANIYFDQKQPEFALRDYRTAISLKPDYFPALDNMGSQFAVLGNFDSALHYLGMAIHVRPDYKVSYSNRALVYMELKDYEKAINDWKTFLRFEPGAADVYNTIGSCFQLMGRYIESLENIDRAIEMLPDASFYLNRSYTYRYMGKMDAARADAALVMQGGLQLPEEHAMALGIQ